MSEVAATRAEATVAVEKVDDFESGTDNVMTFPVSTLTIEMVLNFDPEFPPSTSGFMPCVGKRFGKTYVPVVGKQGKELKVVLSLPHSLTVISKLLSAKATSI